MANSIKLKSAVEMGMCSACERRPPVFGGKNCQECRDYHKGYRKQLRDKGICKCGRMPVPGGRNCELCRANTREHNKRIRHLCIVAYGGYECACCDESTPEFLQLDHVNNDGAEHRKVVGNGNATYWWMIKNNFPPGFQVLCANCNYAKEFYGGCPHQRGKEVSGAKRKRRSPVCQKSQ